MAELNFPEQSRRKIGVRKMKKANLKVDMTPMVDLGFLLIAFFIFTTEISRPFVTNLYMPDDKGDSTLVSRNKSLTILLGENDRIFYYYGTEGEASKTSQINQTSYSEMNGIGRIIRQKQSELEWRKIDRKQFVVLIKASGKSTYENLVNILDEMLINGVIRYSVVDLGKFETTFIGEHK